MWFSAERNRRRIMIFFLLLVFSHVLANRRYFLYFCLEKTVVLLRCVWIWFLLLAWSLCFGDGHRVVGRADAPELCSAVKHVSESPPELSSEISEHWNNVFVAHNGLPVDWLVRFFLFFFVLPRLVILIAPFKISHSVLTSFSLAAFAWKTPNQSCEMERRRPPRWRTYQYSSLCCGYPSRRSGRCALFLKGSRGGRFMSHLVVSLCPLPFFFPPFIRTLFVLSSASSSEGGNRQTQGLPPPHRLKSPETRRAENY